MKKVTIRLRFRLERAAPITIVQEPWGRPFELKTGETLQFSGAIDGPLADAVVVVRDDGILVWMEQGLDDLEVDVDPLLGE